ncbi:MAG: hypothetical protein U1U88_002063 [Lawsonella clevelandensis]
MLIPPEVLEQRAQDPALDAFLAENIDEDPVVPFYLKVTEEQIKVIVPPLPFAAIDFPTRVSPPPPHLAAPTPRQSCSLVVEIPPAAGYLLERTRILKTS